MVTKKIRKVSSVTINPFINNRAIVNKENYFCNQNTKLLSKILKLLIIKFRKMEVSIVFISLFIVIFGICYLYFTARHKERLALIEKDKDVSVFYSSKKALSSNSNAWRNVVLSLGLVSIGVGVGILLGSFLNLTVGMSEEVAFPASIFLMAGVGLLTGFFITKKNEKESI